MFRKLIGICIILTPVSGYALTPTIATNVTAVLTTYDDGARGSVHITWTNNSSKDTWFSIYRTKNSSELTFIATTSANATSFKDSLTATGTYSYGIRSCNSTSCSSYAYSDKIYYTGEIIQKNQPPRETKAGTVLAFESLYRPLKIGDSGDDVKTLQKFLRNHGYAKTTIVTGYFGPKTQAAINLFQISYKEELLLPYGYTKGTGRVGTATMKKINELLANDALGSHAQ